MIDLRPACTAVAGVIDAVTDADLDTVTPCADWTVCDLLAHLDLTAGGDGAPVTDRAGLAARWRTVPGDWADPAAWDGASGDPRLPNATWGRIVLTEAVVHGWDLAVALGVPYAPPEPTLRACLEHVEDFVPRAPLPGLWGPGPVRPGRGAGLLDRIVAVTGRDPRAPRRPGASVPE